MSLPICPRCGSGHVTPSTESAGHNWCLNCKYYGAVVMFHQEPDPRGRSVAPVKTILAEAQRGNQTHRRRGHPMVVMGKTQRVEIHKHFWWEDE